MQRSNFIRCVLLAVPLLIGATSAIVTGDMMLAYGNMPKPALSPPAFLFPVVWTLLYLLMGISMVLVYNEESSAVRSWGLLFMLGQLVFNFCWSVFFFNLGWYLFAFIWLVVLFVLVLLMTIYFMRVRLVAGLMNIPYLLWLLFAAYLNWAIYIMQ